MFFFLDSMTTTSTSISENNSSILVAINKMCPAGYDYSDNDSKTVEKTPKVFYNIKLKSAIVVFDESPLERRFRRLKNKLKANIDVFYSFATFTINNINLERFDSNKEISRLMNCVQMYAKRHPPYEKIKYAWRVEFGKKTGRIHYHVMLSRFIPIEELYSAWDNGHIDIKKLDSKSKVLRYITKYFSKDLKPVDVKWKRENRLFGTSAHLKKYKSDWKFDKNPNLRYVGIMPVNPKKWTPEKAYQRCSKIIANLNIPPTYRLLSKKE